MHSSGNSTLFTFFFKTRNQFFTHLSLYFVVAWVPHIFGSVNHCGSSLRVSASRLTGPIKESFDLRCSNCAAKCSDAICCLEGTLWNRCWLNIWRFCVIWIKKKRKKVTTQKPVHLFACALETTDLCEAGLWLFGNRLLNVIERIK